MKKISIFVAGAKDLELQRLKLKALVNDMNADYLKSDRMIQINVQSYENFENNNQKTYNEFIVNDADLAIFVLDGRIGEKTELEYLLATANLRKSGVPKVVVFVKKYSEVTPEIAYINGLLKANSDDYYTTYENDHDLMSLARRSIEALVDEICKESVGPADGNSGQMVDNSAARNVQSIDKKGASASKGGILSKEQETLSERQEALSNAEGVSPKRKSISSNVFSSSSNTSSGKFRNFYKYMTMVLLPLCLLFVCLNFFPRGPKPHLLIAGGGSAANFIDKYAKDSLKNFKGGYYVHQPSRNAWSLLSEEVVTKQSVRKYYPICISADTLSNNDLLDIANSDVFLSEGVVVGVKLGNDTMVVSLENHPKLLSKLSADCLISKRISVQELSKLLADTSSVNIYATNPGSGTRNNYAKCLSKVGFELKDDILAKFSEDTDLSKIVTAGQPYILLGSKCYQMKDLKGELQDGNAMNFILYHEDSKGGESCVKPIFVYFMAYKNPMCGYREYFVPDEILGFLENLDFDYSEKIVKNKLRVQGLSDVVVNFEELCNI